MNWKRISIGIAVLALVFFVHHTAFGGTGTAGYTSIGASSYATGSSGTTNPPGLLITIPQAGTITKITAHVANSVSSNSSSAKLYAGSAGSLGSLIATTNTNTVTTSYAWVDFTFASPPSVSATTYWIEFVGDGGNGPGGNVGQIKLDTGGAANSSYAKNDTQTPVYGTDRYSMYATYTFTDPVVTAAATSTKIANARINIGNGRILR